MAPQGPLDRKISEKTPANSDKSRRPAPPHSRHVQIMAFFEVSNHAEIHGFFEASNFNRLIFHERRGSMG